MSALALQPMRSKHPVDGGDARPLLRRVAETARPAIDFTLDGRPLQALEGDTVLTAVLTQASRAPQLRRNEFSGEPRAGFCLMGACQDCWIATADGARLRACSTFLVPGMALVTGLHPPTGAVGVDIDGGPP